jgi:hypothetical protein
VWQFAVRVLPPRRHSKSSPGAQIRGRIAGMEVSDEVHWRDFYDRTGKVTSSSVKLAGCAKIADITRKVRNLIAPH